MGEGCREKNRMIPRPQNDDEGRYDLLIDGVYTYVLSHTKYQPTFMDRKNRISSRNTKARS